MFLMTNGHDETITLMPLDRVEALIRLGYDFKDWNEQLEYAE